MPENDPRPTREWRHPPASTSRVAVKAILRERLAGSRPGVAAEATFAGLPRNHSPEIEALIPAHPIPSAVLIPVVDRPEGLTLLLTERASELRHHAGQIAFPGGRVEPCDASPADAALREAEEEIGLNRRYVEVLGYLPDSLIGTGYVITPVISLVSPEADFAIDRSEVASIFEIPLARVLDPSQHQLRPRKIGSMTVDFYEFTHERHTIWGATAGMLMTLYRLLRDPPPREFPS